MSTVRMKSWLRFLSILIGFLDRLVNSEMMKFNCSDVTYIRPFTGVKSWSESQSICRNFSATLPIVDTPDRQKCFDLALRNFFRDPNQAYVWMGANSSGGNPDEWRWLDGSPYNGSKISRGSNFQQGYAYVVRTATSGLMLKASLPAIRYPFVCRYPVSGNVHCKNQTGQTAIVRNGVCYVTYDQNVSWFNARNICLSNGGDLAIFPDLSVLNEIIGAFNRSYWIGLRSIWWNWIDIVSGMTMDVAYTLWNDNQPDGNNPQCLSTKASNNSRWRDYNCSEPQLFICQISKPLPSSSTQASSKTTFQPSASVAFTTIHQETKGNETSHRTIDGGGNIALGVGIGVGIGVPIIIAIIAATVFIYRRRQKRLISAPDITTDENSGYARLSALRTTSSPENPYTALSASTQQIS